MNILQVILSKKRFNNIDLNIVFDGDSLTYGYNGTYPLPPNDQIYPRYILNTYLNNRFKTVQFNSFGVGGQRLLGMIADAGTQIDPLIDVTKTNVCIAWEDVNAILGGGRTAQQNYDDAISYCQSRKNAGFDYVIWISGYYPKLMLDGNYLDVRWTPERLTAQKDYFNLCVNADLNQVPWDLCLDLRNVQYIGGGEGETLNTTYLFDSVHCTTLGYYKIGDYVWNNGIKQLFL